MTEPAEEQPDPRLIPRPVPEHARVEREWPGTPDTDTPWHEPEDAICKRCGDDFANYFGQRKHVLCDQCRAESEPRQQDT